MSGTIFFSIALLLLEFFSFPLHGRSYEIQFFTINIYRKIDYPRLKKMGIDTVIFRAFQDLPESGGLYFANSQFRVISPVLEKLLPELDGQDISMCAWMIGRKFNWINSENLFDYEFADGRRRMIKKLDLFNPAVAQTLVTVYKELASKKIDSILIQDDFILRYNEGFSDWGEKAFAEQFGAPANAERMIYGSNEYAETWRKVKQKQLKNMLQLIVRNCRMVNSAIKTGINVYYETPLKPEHAAEWYGYTLRDLLDSGVDIIYLMSYQRQIKDELKLNETAAREVFRKMVETAYALCGDKLAVKLQLRDWKTSERVPVQEIKDYLALIPSGVKRVCFTPVSPGDMDYLERIIRPSAADFPPPQLKNAKETH